MDTDGTMNLWLKDTGEKIRCLNYEIEIGLRIFSRGSIALPTGPGLGIVLDEEKLARYRVAV